MARIQNIKPHRLFMGRLQHGQDLLDEITKICSKENITLGRISAVGAVQQARIGYYNQDSRQYEFLQFNQHLEIMHL